MAKGEQKILDDIAQYGWHVMKVLDEDNKPAFAYSIGLFATFKHPEIIMYGLDLDVMQQIINNLGDDIRKGIVYSDGPPFSNILEGYDCRFVTVPKGQYKMTVGWATRHYGNADFPLLQCVWPAKNGAFPWEEKYPEDLKRLQPVLGEEPTS